MIRKWCCQAHALATNSLPSPPEADDCGFFWAIFWTMFSQNPQKVPKKCFSFWSSDSNAVSHILQPLITFPIWGWQMCSLWNSNSQKKTEESAKKALQESLFVSLRSYNQHDDDAVSLMPQPLITWGWRLWPLRFSPMTTTTVFVWNNHIWEK